MKALLLSGAVLFLYGGLLLTLLVRIPGISWHGHLFGFIAGVLAAWLTRAMGNQRKCKLVVDVDCVEKSQ